MLGYSKYINERVKKQLWAHHIQTYCADYNLDSFSGFVATCFDGKQTSRTIWYVTRWNGHTDVLSVELISNGHQVSQIT
jgi:hypothetical protein